MADQYGKQPSLAIRYAAHSAGERLGAFAREQAQLVEESWRIVACEYEIKLSFAHGITLSGTIDRIDRHPNGSIRVIDYKTGEAAHGPDKSHFGTVPKDRDLPEWAAVDLQTDPAKAPKWKAWADLQLPLYAWCVRNDPELQTVCGTGPIETGYIALPKALTQTGWLPFDTESDALRDAAITCAEHIAAAVQAREFWPPSPTVKYDDIAPWLHHGVDHDIVPDELLAWMEAQA